MKMNPAKQTRWGERASCWLVCALLLSACAQATAQIVPVEPVIEETGYEKFDLKNCEEALEDLHVPVTEYFNVKQEVTIADQATAAASSASYPLSAQDKEKFSAQVTEAYQQNFTAAQTGLESQEFLVPKDRAANFEITWNSKVYTATLEFEANGAAHTVEYQYTLTIPEIGERTIAICGG